MAWFSREYDASDLWRRSMMVDENCYFLTRHNGGLQDPGPETQVLNG